MREIVIRKNKHYPFPFFPIGLPIRIRKNKRIVIQHEFMFTDYCLYDLMDADQGDVNKLFGFSIGCHHRTSFRFGWRPNLKNHTIEIVGYEYHDGIRQKTMPIREVKLNCRYTYTLIYSPVEKMITYKVWKMPTDYNIISNEIKLSKYYGFGYTLGAYFGGNEKAPHNIVIYKA